MLWLVKNMFVSCSLSDAFIEIEGKVLQQVDWLRQRW